MYMCIYAQGHALELVAPIPIKPLGQQLSFKTTWAFLGGLEPELQNYNFFKKITF